MDIKIGRQLLIIFLFVGISCCAKEVVQLELTDMQGVPSSKGALGQSFLLRLKVKGGFKKDSLQIPGLDQFYAEPRGNYKKVSTINGKSSSSMEQNYLLRPKKEGQFEIGPVYLMTDKGIRYSNQVKLEVAQKYKNMKPQKSSSMILRCEPDIETAYVGQKIKVRLYLFSRGSVQIKDIKMPQLDPDVFSITELRRDCDGHEEIDGKEYLYCSWVADLVVNKPGKWLIPEAEMTCVIHGNKAGHSNFMSALFMQMGLGQEKKVYSDGFILMVKALPDDKKSINAIGSFSSYDAYLDKTEIKQSEAATFMLKLVGSDTVEMNHPELNVPKGLKYYPSRMQHTRQEGAHITYFEYIMQGIKPGVWTIPSQKFTFFDTVCQSYKNLQTNELSLEVLPGIYSTEIAEDPEQINNEGHNDSEIVPINTDGPWYRAPEKSIPFLWFCILALIPILYVLYQLCVYLFMMIKTNHDDFFAYKRGFAHARARLAQLEKINKPEGLYDLITQLFAARLRVPKSQINQSVIDQALRSAGASDNLIQEWNDYFYQVQVASYDKQSNRSMILFDLTHGWLKKLEEVV